MRRSLGLLATLTTLTLATGCFIDPNAGKDGGGGGGGGGGWGTPSEDMAGSGGGWGGGGGGSDLPPVEQPPDPEMPTVDPEVPTYYGVYLVKTKWDLTGKDVLPGPTSAILAFFADFNTKPVTAFLHLLRDANIPNVSDALKGVSALDFLASAGDALVVGLFSDFPELQSVLNKISDVAHIFESLELHNQIAIGAKGTDGTYKVTQQLVAVGFEWTDEYGTTLKKTYNLSATARANAKIKGKFLTVTNVKTMADFDGFFDGGVIDLPLGELVIAAINDLVLGPWGFSTLGEALAEAFPCEAIAEKVDIDAVESICETGINVLAEMALTPVREFSLHNIVVGRASVTGIDRKTTEPQDNRTDKLKGTQTFNLTINSTNVIDLMDAKFEGERIASPIVPIEW